jgi:hypothetical protein
VLWRNKGDGTFEDRTKEMALEGVSPSVGALGSDVNNDHAVDIVLTGWQESPSILLNQRGSPFQTATPWTSKMPGPTAGAIALDFDSDRWMDLAFTHWAPPGLSLWRNVRGVPFERVALPDPGWMRGWGLSALDYDNDGHADLVAVGENFSGEGRIILLRNEGEKGFRDVTHETGLDKIALRNPRSVIAFDYDGDGATDLLITQNNAPPVLLKNVGGAKNAWLQLALNATAGNKSALGTDVELMSGARREKWSLTGASGYLGQNSAEIHAGLGNRYSVDVLHLRWPSGLVQDELQIPAGKRSVISEGVSVSDSPKP